MNIHIRPPTLPRLVPKLRTVFQPIARNASSRRDINVDPKRDVIRRTLYPPNIRNRATPTGSWRPDTMRALRRTILSIQAHETIERAFKLHLRHQRQHRQAELDRKYECLRNAMIELEKVNPHLAFGANKVEDPRVRTEAESALMKSSRVAEKKGADGRIRGLFPRELKAPIDTPSKDGWNYDWKPRQAQVQ